MKINLRVLLFLLICCKIGFSQGPTLKETPAIISPIDSSYLLHSFEIGKSKNESFKFNHGIISDPFLLLQGQVSGLQVYNRGGDPNNQSVARIRGLASLDSDIQPLVVIDGVPNAAIENIDPNNIASIEVLKSGYAKSQYGARGANGVLLITTKKHPVDSLLSVQYYGLFGISNATRDIEVFSRDEFINNGGIDLGSDQNYLSEIKRTGISHVHGFTLSNGNANYNYSISGNYRNINGILKKSGFRQYNGSASLSFRLFDDRLKVNLNGKATEKNQDLSFTEAFRYAVTANPTVPIFGIDSPFPFNLETFGGYFETLGLFGSFNPVAMLDLNSRTRDLNSFLYSAHVNYQVFDGLQIGTTYAAQSQDREFSLIGQETSYFLGRTIDGVRRGYGVSDTGSGNFVYSDSYVKFYKDISDIDIKLRAGYSYQNFESNSTMFSYQWPDLTPNSDLEVNSDQNKLISFYNTLGISKGDKLFIDAGLRYEGSSLLIEDKWQLYPSTQISYDFGGGLAEEDHLILFGGFGVTGSQNDVYTPDPFGLFVPIFETEISSEYDLGINYTNRRIQLGLEVYSRNTSNTNINELLQLENPYADIKTRGLDLTISTILADRKNFKYTSGLHLSTYRSTVDFDFRIPYANPGPPGFGSTTLLSLGFGEEFGQIFAPVFEGVDADGFTMYKDVNGDRTVNVSSPVAIDTDYADVGNAIPDFEFGWRHNIKANNYEISVLLRGAFGHSLVNINRMIFENDFVSSELYNRVNTSKAVEGLKEARYSSLYVEDASFVKLDNLSISRAFRLGADNKILSLSIIGQNLLTITGYTGPDPEPSFFDMEGGGYFSPGLDRRSTYRPSRTISVAAKIDIN